MFDITSKLEINLDDPSIPIPVATELAAKYRVSAIIVYDQTLIRPILQHRLSSNGRYKVILAVDFKSGSEYAMSKFKHFSRDFDISSVDGFDIRLTTTKANNIPLNEVEVFNEISAIRGFLTKIKQTFEIRFTIDALSRNFNQVEYALKTFSKIPCTMIRLDSHLNIHESKVNKNSLKNIIEIIRRYTATPIKSGVNVDLDLIKDLGNSVARFDVTVVGMHNIIRQLNDKNTKSLNSGEVKEEIIKEFTEEATGLTQDDINSLGQHDDQENIESKDNKENIESKNVANQDNKKSEPIKLVKQKISARKIKADSKPRELKVQRSINTAPRTVIDESKMSKQNKGITATPPPKNARRQ